MRNVWLWCVLVLAGVTALAKTPEGFLTGWAEVQKSARAEHKLIYLHFTTDWCGWCRRIEADTYPDAAVKKALADFAAASLDCTVKSGAPSAAVKTHLDLLRKFGGSGYPFLVIVDEDGETVYGTINGYLPPTEFLGELTAAKTCRKDYQAFLIYAKTADQQSYDYALRAMRMLARIQHKAQADAMARRVLNLDPDNVHGNGADASWLALQQLSPERWETDGATLLASLKRFDAKNEKGLREQADWQYAYSSYQRKQHAKCIAVLRELIAAAKTLREAQNVHGLLGVAQAGNGDTEAARATLTKAIALAPKSRLGQFLQQQLDKLPAAKTTP